MNHLLRSLACLLLLNAGTAFCQSTTRIDLGINWMLTNRFTNGGALKSLFDDSIACTMYHVGDAFDSTTTSGHLDSMAVGWSAHSGAKMLFGRFGQPIYLYAESERLQYDAIETHLGGPDSLKHFYFHNHPNGEEFPPSPATPDHWEITGTTPPSGVVVLSGNEFPSEWEFPASRRFVVAVKLQVASLNAGSAQSVLSVKVTHYHAATNARTDTTFNIPWNLFTHVNADTVVFSQPFTLASDFKYNADSMLVEVSASRIVTTRMAWVTVEDLKARDLMTARDFSFGDTAGAPWRAIHDSIWVQLQRDDSTIRATMRDSSGNDGVYFTYTNDEPTVSEYGSMGEVNAAIGRRGLTEVQVPENYRRFMAFVHPKVLWSGGFNAATGQMVDYLDSSLRGNLPELAMDSCGGACYKVGTLRSHVSNSYGYFPHAPGDASHLVADSVYALDTTYVADGSTGRDWLYSFDIYDLRQGAGAVNNLHWSFVHAMQTDSATYFSGTSDTTAAWWANIFNYNQLHAGFHWQDSVTKIGTGGYYKDAPPPTPAELEAPASVALAMGARGLLFYTGVTIPNCDPIDTSTTYHFCLGFVDDSGRYASDAATDLARYQYPAPTKWRTNTKWLMRYGRWLRDYAGELASKKWVGAYTRHGIENDTHPSSIIPYVKSLGNTTFINFDSDRVTRPRLTHWPRAGVPDTIENSVMPDDLRWVTYGFFVDPVFHDPAYPRYYVSMVNMACDMRSLTCRWISDPDSLVENKFAMRGVREVSSKLNLNHTIAKYWKITVLDSTHESQIVEFDGRMKWRFQPGQGRIFRVEPYTAVSVGKNICEFNNGRRLEYDGTLEHVCYFRGDSVFYRRTADLNPIVWEPEQFIAGTSSAPASHPSIRVQGSFVGITYQVDSAPSYKVYIKTNSSSGDSSFWSAPVLLASFAKAGAVFEPTPVIAPFTGIPEGFVVAWSDVHRIGMRAMQASPRTLGATGYVDATGNIDNIPVVDSVAGFPTIMESLVNNEFGLAFQQRRPAQLSQIFFSLLTINPTTLALSHGAPEWLSKLTGGDCLNEHPSIDRGHAAFVSKTQTIKPTGAPSAYMVVPTWITPSGTLPTTNEWSVTFDAPVYGQIVRYVPGTVAFYSGILGRSVWHAMRDQSWHRFTEFRPAITGTSPFAPPSSLYEYPSIRMFDGVDSTNNEPGIISYYSEDAQMRCGLAPNAYPFPNKTPGWKMYRWTAAATTPNLGMNARDLAAFADTRGEFHSTPDDDVRVTVNPIPQTAPRDTVQKFTFINTSKSGNPSCWASRYVIRIDRLPTTFDSLPEQTGSNDLMAFHRSDDSDAYDSGLRVIGHAMLIDSTNDHPKFVRAHLIEDSLDAAYELGGGGKMRIILEAASAITGLRLARIDSIEITYTGPEAIYDTLMPDLTAFRDSTVFFRVRMEFADIDSLQSETGDVIVMKEEGTVDIAKQSLAHGGRSRKHDDFVNPIFVDAYPVPVDAMHPATTLAFTVPDIDAGEVARVRLYDVFGAIIATPLQDTRPAGRHTVLIECTGLRSGNYIAEVKLKNNVQCKLIVVIK